MPPAAVPGAQVQVVAEGWRLPHEVLELIVSHIGGPYIQHYAPHKLPSYEPYKPCGLEQTLKRISLVCAAFAAACQPYLFHTVFVIFDTASPRRAENLQNPARYERLQDAVTRNPKLQRYIKRLQLQISFNGECEPFAYLDRAAGDANDLSAQAALRVMAGLKKLEHVSVAGYAFMGAINVPPAIQQAMVRCISANNIIELELCDAAYPVTLLRGFRPCLDSLTLDWMDQAMDHAAHAEGTVCTTVAPRRLNVLLGYISEDYAPLLLPCTASLFSRVEEMKVVSGEMHLRVANELLWRTAATVKHIHLTLGPYYGPGEDIAAPDPVPQQLQLPQLTTMHLEVTRRRRVGGHGHEEPNFLFHYLRHPAFQRISSFQLTHHYPLQRISQLLPDIGVAEAAAEPHVQDCGGWDRVDEMLADKRVFRNLSEVVLEYSSREDETTYADTRREAEALLPLTRGRVRRIDVRFIRAPSGWF